jgi:hypothetical protein
VRASSTFWLYSLIAPASSKATINPLVLLCSLSGRKISAIEQSSLKKEVILW